MENKFTRKDALDLLSQVESDGVIAHTITTMKIAGSLSKIAGLSDSEADLLQTACAVHAIKSNSLDSCNYLLSKGWDRDVCMLVLHSREVINLSGLPEHLYKLHKILIIANICSDSNGCLRNVKSALAETLKTLKTPEEKAKAQLIADSAKVWLDELCHTNKLIHS